jgi:hypothetical protein
MAQTIYSASASNFIQGSGINTPPAQLVNTLNSITEKGILPYLGDEVFLPSPIFWWFARKGTNHMFRTGELVYPLVTAEEMTGGAYYGDQLLDTAVIDSIQPANQVWKFYYQSLSLPVTDIILNRGGTSALDLVKTKFKVASASFLAKLTRALWHTAPQNGSLDIDDLDAWAGQTTNTIAGISRSANSFWQPAANVNIGAALTATSAEPAYQSVVYGYDEPDGMVMTNTQYANFKSSFFTNVRFTDSFMDKEAMQMGFRYHFLYNNCVVMADRNCPSGSVYIFNSKYIFPCFNSNDFFTCDPWIKPSNQRVVVTSMYVTWNVICPSPRMNVKLTNVT